MEFFCPDKQIYPTNVKKINLGGIASSGFLGHIKSYEKCGQKETVIMIL